MNRTTDLSQRETFLLIADLDDMMYQLSQRKPMTFEEWCHWSRQSGYNALINELRERIQKGGE